MPTYQTGTIFNDKLIGSTRDDFLSGGDGNDELVGGWANDTLLGGAGDDVLEGNDDRDLMDGGPGADRMYGDYRYPSRYNYDRDELESADTMHGGAGGDFMDGGTGNDALYGEADNDNLYGNLGNDYLSGGFGNDILFGYYGIDALWGDAGDDRLYGEGDDDRLIGGDGTDFLSGGDGADKLQGDAGNDILWGDGGADFLSGGDGVDVLNGGGDADIMVGGFGSDLYTVDNTFDTVEEQFDYDGGTDSVHAFISYVLPENVENLTLAVSSAARDGGGNALNNRIKGNSTANVLRGEAGNDQLFGMDGNDLLDGGTGLNYLAGGMGDDTYVVDDNGDTLYEAAGQGNDIVLSSIGYALGLNVENLQLTEAGGSINGTGNALANRLTGNSAVNQLAGGDGNDLLDGSAGADTLVGGNGDDIFVFDGADLAPAGTRWFGQTGADTIKLHGGDALDLTMLGDDRITGIEIIDMSAAGSSQLSIAFTDVRAMSDTGIVRVTGTSDDHVTASGWNQGADMVVGDSLYHTFAAGGASLLIDTDVALTLM